MKHLTNRISAFFGVILISAVMVISFLSCQQEPDLQLDPQDNPQYNSTEIPSVLQYTEWTHTSGDKISFDKNSVTITPQNGSPQKFPLKDTSSSNSDGINQTTLFFKDNQSQDDTIVYRDGVITMVSFSAVNRTNGWSHNIYQGVIVNLGDYTYKVFNYNNTKFASITSYKGTGGNLIIPSEINGIIITSIFDEVFQGKNLTSVTIPDNIKAINFRAFDSNNGLISITIGANVYFPHEGDDRIAFDGQFEFNYVTRYNRAKGTYTLDSDGIWNKVN